jgi:uncharacterized phage-like protein YoqJ
MIICGTGHRPDKLGGYDEESHLKLVRLAYEYIAEDPECRFVITGGALGWDQALARAAYTAGIRFAMYLPFDGFDSKWPTDSRKYLEWLCKCADEVKYISPPGYEVWKMNQRNKAMVNDADLVLALWNNTPGGTSNCISYAMKVGKPIVNLWDKYNESR